MDTPASAAGDRMCHVVDRELLNRRGVTAETDVYAIGNDSLLEWRIVGLICSVQCPGSIVIRTFDAIRELRDARVVVAGGFHSPMEQECLDFLLRGDQPVVICPARHPASASWPAGWLAGVDAGRLLIVSPFGEEVQRTTAAHAQLRNEFVADLATAVLIPHASPGGKAEATARRVIGTGRPLLTFDCEENASLLKWGAQPYDLARLKSLLSPA